jgi:hypothetical protein
MPVVYGLLNLPTNLHQTALVMISISRLRGSTAGGRFLPGSELSTPHLYPQAYEKQRGARREEQKKLQRASAQDQVRGFLEKEAAIVSRPLNPFTSKMPLGPGPGDRE